MEIRSIHAESVELINKVSRNLIKFQSHLDEVSEIDEMSSGELMVDIDNMIEYLADDLVKFFKKGKLTEGMIKKVSDLHLSYCEAQDPKFIAEGKKGLIGYIKQSLENLHENPTADEMMAKLRIINLKLMRDLKLLDEFKLDTVRMDEKAIKTLVLQVRDGIKGLAFDGDWSWSKAWIITKKLVLDIRFEKFIDETDLDFLEEHCPILKEQCTSIKGKIEQLYNRALLV